MKYWKRCFICKEVILASYPFPACHYCIFAALGASVMLYGAIRAWSTMTRRICEEGANEDMRPTK
jgi:hypothetical protein